MQKTVCEWKKCTACKACIEKCPKSCITFKDELSYCNAVINTEECIGCNMCKAVCPVLHQENLKSPIDCKQGWSSNETIRENASSGGIASAIVEQFLEEGGAVYACVFEKGAFPFTQIISQRDVEKMRGSKYVKSDPQDIYGKITESLRNNQKVLFIGLPCQVQAAKNFISPKLQENFYSVDLICHGCGSPEILKKYLLKKDIDIDNIEKIRFRTKTKFGLVTEWRFLSRDGTEDDYLKTFLTGLSYTENCFECKFARLSRAGDVTIGDSWGSELPSEEQERGISLILCQTAKGQRLINSSKIHVEDVNLDRAIEFNHQLRCPMKKPKRYDVFWNGIKKGHSLHFMLLRCFPKSTIMLFVKKIKKYGGENIIDSSYSISFVLKKEG